MFLTRKLSRPLIHLSAGAVIAASLLGFACAPPPLHASTSMNPGEESTSGGGGGQQGVVTSLVPDSANVAAPSIIKPGVRVTFQTDSASIAGQGSVWTPDPDGNWVDQNGQRFDRSKKEMSGSAKSYDQYDVVAVDDKHAFLCKRTFLVNPVFAAPTMNASVFMAGAPGFVDAVWANPEALAKVPNVVKDSVKVARGPWKVGNKTTDAIELSHSWPNMHDLYVYDLKTGVLLQRNVSAVGKATPTAPDENISTGNAMLVSTAVVSLRPITMPWSGTPEPDWTKTCHSIDYTASAASVVNGQEMNGKQFTVSFVVAQRGSGWTTFKRTTTGPDATGAQHSSTDAAVTSQGFCNPLWIAPDVLAKLQQGQVLDRDPVTQIEMKVGGTSNGPTGPMLDILSTNSADKTRTSYDLKTGAMARIESYTPGSNMHVTMTLSRIR